MKEQEIIGIEENLIFYYPLGKDKLYAQRYNKETDDVILEWEISGPYHYDISLSIFNMFNNPDCLGNIKKYGKSLVDPK